MIRLLQNGVIAFMIGIQFPTDKHIIDCLNDNYSIEVKSLTPLSGSADMNASIYKVQASDQSSYFVKVKFGHDKNINVFVLDLLHKVGVKQIILPIKTIQGDASLYVDNFSFILYPFVEGVNGFSQKLTDKQWIMLGKVLRKVHEIQVLSSLQNQIRKETYSPKWRNIVRSLCEHLPDDPPNNDVITLEFLHFLKEKRLIIQHLVDRAEQLSEDIKKLSPNLVLCHSDIHGGNVLIKKNSSIYIIDWDDPIIAPKERDLMFIGGGVANVWNDPEEEISFYKGYGNVDVNISILAYYRYERIIEDIAEYGQVFLFTKPDKAHKNRLELFDQFVSMFDSEGVVDIAFKTDREFKKK